jgi:hypothetical protein
MESVNWKIYTYFIRIHNETHKALFEVARGWKYNGRVDACMEL